MKWTAELEVALFHSMHGHKPVGLNKHFHMACIQHRLQQSIGYLLTTDQIWAHLRTLYDLEALDDFERFPFPNEEREFSLPDHFLPEKFRIAPALLEGEGEGFVVRKHPRQSSSPSPASSPIGRPPTKRKRL